MRILSKRRGGKRSPILSPAPIHQNPELAKNLFDEYKQKLFSPYLHTLIGKNIENFRKDGAIPIILIICMIILLSINL